LTFYQAYAIIFSMSSSQERMITTKEQPREFIKFRNDEQAIALTLDALSNVGFEIETDTSKIDPKRFKTFTGSYPEIAAVYTNPKTGISIEAGISLHQGSDEGEYDWSGKVLDQTGSDHLAPLVGNTDNSQREFKAILTGMLGCAEFGVPSEQVPRWTEEYKAWEQIVDEQTAPLYGEA
jgi:hypothetical protein